MTKMECLIGILTLLSVFGDVLSFSREGDPIELIPWRWQCQHANCVRVDPRKLNNQEVGEAINLSSRP